jgi:aminoglycoside phosphotransferase (APT) family kinase protein
VTVNTDLELRLLEVLRTTSSRPDLTYADQPKPLSGGFWAVLLALTLADPPPGWPRRLVARIMPDAATARKETIVQAAVAAAGFPTPAVRASGGPDDGLGQAFMVMDMAAGSPLLADLSGGGALSAALRLPRQLPDTLALIMARLHALDPEPVRAALAGVDAAPSTVPDLLDMLAQFADLFGRADLADAARWLSAHPPRPGHDVICHGDLHPFNVLVDSGKVTLLDWSSCLLAPRTHDVAFTTLMLSDPPLRVPTAVRPVIRMAGRLLAATFRRRYRAHSGVAIDRGELAWQQAVVCMRALTEAASWVHYGVIDDHKGHPWLISGAQLAAQLTKVTGIQVRPI